MVGKRANVHSLMLGMTLSRTSFLESLRSFARPVSWGLCRIAELTATSSSSPAGVSPVRVATRRPGSRLAALSGNGPGRSPVSKAPLGEANG